MKRFLKVLSVVVLAFSCLYLSLALFLNHVIEDDVIDTVLASSVVDDTLAEIGGNALVLVGIDESYTEPVVALIENDAQAQEVLKAYASSILNDAINDENTFDQNALLVQLENKKDMIYELAHPDMTKEQFDQHFNEAIQKMNLESMYQSTVDKVAYRIETNEQTKEVMTKAYFFHNSWNIYLAIFLMAVSFIYLVCTSLKEKGLLANTIMTVYLLCGIFTFVMAVAIVFVLSALLPSTITFKISSIRYMYICGGGYMLLSIIGFIINIFLKRKAIS